MLDEVCNEDLRSEGGARLLTPEDVEGYSVDVKGYRLDGKGFSHLKAKTACIHLGVHGGGHSRRGCWR